MDCRFERKPWDRTAFALLVKSLARFSMKWAPMDQPLLPLSRLTFWDFFELRETNTVNSNLIKSKVSKIHWCIQEYILVYIDGLAEFVWMDGQTGDQKNKLSDRLSFSGQIFPIWLHCAFRAAYYHIENKRTDRCSTNTSRNYIAPSWTSSNRLQSSYCFVGSI